MPTDSADAALERVLASVGATLPHRDAADIRVIDDVRNRTGQIIDSQEQVGGWPVMTASQAATIDTDQDGLPDDWEKAHGLNPNDASDASQIAPDGYTWLEKYLNELTPSSYPPPPAPDTPHAE